jgi:PKD repeat protein
MVSQRTAPFSTSARSARPRLFRASALTYAALVLGAFAKAQQPLFTFVQTSDSQAGSEAEWQGFEDVLELIARAGTPGALIPRPVDLVLFAGDITLHNSNSEWVRCRSMFDAWLTSNNIPLLCIPGNHDQGSSAGTTQLYEQYIGSAAVWETGSESFTGQNGKGRNTGWAGLRIIGFNSSVGDYNQMTASDVALVGARVSAAAAASENVLLLTHHPHDGSSRMPLASVLPNPAIVGYLRGHSGNPGAKLGLTGINNPHVWDVNTNKIVADRDAVYFEVFQTQLKAYVIILDDNPTQLPAPKIIPLVYPMRAPLAQSIGFQGASHAGARAWPSGYAPEKKLWFQGGNWFGVLWHEASLSWRIFRLDTFAQTWVDTGTSVSSSSTRSFDALADGTKLYLGAHVYSVPSAPGAGAGGQVLRYSYNATTRTYALDAGFPVTINDARSESLGLARDSAGTLWATWTADGNVFETHTLGGDDASWSAPALLPFTSATGLDPEDVSAAVAFDGKVALLWTDRVAGEIGCVVRADTDAPTTWLLENALSAPGAVSDTLDVATSAGRLYVATTTPAGALRLVRRDVGLAGIGSWSLHTVTDAATGLSQPIVLVDETQQLLRVFATGASPTGGSALGGGVIYEKSAPLATLAFGPGKGSVVLQDGQNAAMGRASSTRQPLNATSGLVVVASNELSQRGWHEFTSLGTPPPAPTADFNGSPRSGNAPLLVHFSDLSSGSPSDWLWTFGDGQTSTASSPDHAYASPGTYTVSLRASNSAGSNTLTRSAYVTVSTTTGTSVTKTSIADASVGEEQKNTNYGTNSTVRVRNQGGKSFRCLLKFDLAGVTGTISSAKLRLLPTDSSDNGGSVYPVVSTWTETGVTWNTQPTLPASPSASLGAVTSGTWKEVDVTSAVSAGGLVSLALSGGSTDLAAFTSREGTSANRPQLVLTLQSAPQAPVAEFSGTPLSGTAPLTVQFTDQSSGAPTTWSWNFGDAANSTQASPAHVYATPGTYTVALTVSNASGANTRTRTGYVTVLPPSGVGQVFRPVADARVYEGSPNNNYGLDAVLRMKTQLTSTYQSFLRFDLTGLSGTPTSARLRLFVTDESNSGGSIYLVPNTWSETTITWANKLALPATPLVTAGAAPLGTWVEFDVSSAVLGPGVVSFALAGGTTNSVYYSSREGANPPELVVQTSTP